MSRVDEMREVVNKLAGNHAARRSSLDALRQNVRAQRAGAADAVSGMAADRAAMSVELHSGLTADLLGLRNEVQTTLDDFLAERHMMATDLKEQLDATREQREEHVNALRTEARQFVGNVAADRQAMAEDLFNYLNGAQLELSTGVRTLLGNYTTQRVMMSRQQDEALATDGAERQHLVTEMIAHTQGLLSRFTAEQRAAAAQLHENLTANWTGRQQLVSGMIADIQALLKNIAADNDATAVELRARLADDHQTRSTSVADFMAEVNENRRNMAEALANRLDAFTNALETHVSDSLTGFAAERADLRRSLVEVAKLWREFAAAMQGKPPSAQPQPTEAVPPVPPPTALPVEDTDERLLAYLAQHPDGAKLVELEPLFGMSRPQLGKYLRGLVDSGKVVKDPETLVYKLT